MPARAWLYDAMTLDREVRARENNKMQSDLVFSDITNSSTESLIESISNTNFNHPTEENTEMGINLAEKYKQMTEFYIQHGITQEQQIALHTGLHEGWKKGWQEGLEEGWKKGRQDGWLEGLREGKIRGNILGCISTMRSLHYSQDEILAKLEELYSLTAEQAMPYMDNASK